MSQLNIYGLLSGAGQVTCPTCANTVQYTDGDHSTHFACANCSTYFAIAVGGAPTVLRQFDALHKPAIQLPLGNTCELETNLYTVIGLVVKRDRTEGVTWREYLLFAPEVENYHVLAEVDGNWVLIKKIDGDAVTLYRDYTEDDKATQTYEARINGTFRTYYHYASYTFDVIYASGEFDWDILADEGHLDVHEYTSPPYLLTNEVASEGHEWYKGEHIDQQVIAKGFNIDIAMLPPKTTQGAVEPPKVVAQYTPMKKFTLMLLIGILLVSLIAMFSHSSQVVYTLTGKTQSDSLSWSSQKPIVSSPFVIANGGSLEINLNAGISNDWIELGVALVNDATGKTFEKTSVLEFYEGNDADGYWSEGSRNADVVFSSVPAGNYHLNVFPYTESATSKDIVARVVENPPMYGNFWITLFAILIVPVVQYFRVQSYYEG